MAITKVNGTALRIIRERSELTIRGFSERLAAELGRPVDPAHLSKIERGIGQPAPDLLGAMARVLGIPKIDLVTDVGREDEEAA